MGIARTGWLRLRHMTAAAGKDESVSLSLVMEVDNLEVEEELSTMSTLAWAEGVWLGTCGRKQQKAWRKPIFEVQTRRVRGPAGAVMCDVGIELPQRHPFFLEEQVAVDMRVCPQDVKKMLLKRARTVYWKKWAATHECEELKEGAWLEPIKAMLRRTT